MGSGLLQILGVPPTPRRRHQGGLPQARAPLPPDVSKGPMPATRMAGVNGANAVLSGQTCAAYDALGRQAAQQRQRRWCRLFTAAALGRRL